MKFKFIFLLICLLLNAYTQPELIKIEPECFPKTQTQSSCTDGTNVCKAKGKIWLDHDKNWGVNEPSNKFYDLKGYRSIFEKADNICAFEQLMKSKPDFLEGYPCPCVSKCYSTNECETNDNCNNGLCKTYKAGDCPAINVCQPCAKLEIRIGDKCIAQTQAVLDLINQLSNLTEQTPKLTEINQLENRLKEITSHVQTTDEETKKLTQEATTLLEQIKAISEENKSQLKIQEETDKQIQDFNNQMSQLTSQLQELQTEKQKDTTQITQATTELQKLKTEKKQDEQKKVELNNKLKLLTTQMNELKKRKLENQNKIKAKKLNLKQKMNELVKKSKQKKVKNR